METIAKGDIVVVPHSLDEAYFVILEKEIFHLRQLMEQHDKATELAISKSEATTNERFAKANEFREQQKDIIATFARQKETSDALNALHTLIDNERRSVTERYEGNVKNMVAKVDTLSTHFNEKLADSNKIVIEKFDNLKESFGDKLHLSVKTLDEKILANISTESHRFAAADAQMNILISSNAEVSNRALNELNRWKESTQGSLKVIQAVGSFIAAIVIGLLIAYITSMKLSGE